MTTRPHPNTTTALPLKMPDYKCHCSRADVRRVCTGCYVFFCIECYEDHRRKESTKFGYVMGENDLLVEAIRPLQSTGTNVRRFDPLTLRNSIYDARDRCHAGENRAVVNAMKALRKLLNERHDKLMGQITPITADLQSTKNAQNYINAHLDRFKEELRQKNNELDQTDIAKFASVIDMIADIDWNHLIDISTVTHHGSVARNARPTTGGIQLPPSTSVKLDYNCLSRKPFRRIDKQKDGLALGASDHLVIYVRNNELVIVEADADYSIIVPMCMIDGIVPEIVDICWSSLIGAFIILTEKDAFELSPHLKRLKRLEQIQAPDGTNFGGCTCFDHTLLVSYEDNCLLDEWQRTGDQEWTHVKQWDWTSAEARSPCKIRYVRYSRTGSTVGCLLSNNPKSDRFEIRDSKTMNRQSSVIIPARPCCGCVWMPDNSWLVAIRDWYIIFRVSRDGQSVESVTDEVREQTTILNIALVAFALVIIRTQRTVLFYDLLQS